MHSHTNEHLLIINQINRTLFVSSTLLVRVVGSLVASRHVVVKMLEFADRHEIKPVIEELEMGVEVRSFFVF